MMQEGAVDIEQVRAFLTRHLGAEPSEVVRLGAGGAGDVGKRPSDVRLGAGFVTVGGG
jgi:hypothetical protein